MKNQRAEAPPTAATREGSVSSRRTWGVIGGGVLGMTLALRLAERGEKVTLIEAAPGLGGLTSPWRLGDVRWDRFYHVIVNVDRNLLALLEELDLADSIRWIGTQAGFYSEGRLHSMSSAIDFLKFPPLNLYQKLRLGLTILYGSRFGEWRELERIPVEQWLRRVSGDSTFERIWLPLLKAKLGDEYQRTSAAFIWAYIRRMYSARQSGLKREQFGYVPGGYETIIAALEGRLRAQGVTIRTEAPTTSIERVTDEDPGLEVTFADGSSERFSHVVSTLPPAVTSRLTPQLGAEEHRRARDVDYIGVVCPSLLLDEPISPYYVTNILEPWVPFTGIIEMTAVVDPNELGRRHLVYLPKYVSEHDDDAFAESDESIRKRCLEILERMYPGFASRKVHAFQVARARRVMALPTLGYSEKLPPQETSVPGLFAISSAAIVDGVLHVDSTLGVAQKGFAEHLDPILSDGAV